MFKLMWLEWVGRVNVEHVSHDDKAGPSMHAVLPSSLVTAIEVAIGKLFLATIAKIRGALSY